MIATAVNWSAVRSEFPILTEQVRGQSLVYLDNAATSQKPRAVLDRLDRFWRTENANVHRGVHHLSQLATKAFDDARETIRVFMNAYDVREIIFTKGCTEGINLVANGLERSGHFLPGDVILLSTMEHHSNIVPWQLVAERTGARIIPIPISDDGEIDLDAYRSLLASQPVKLVGVVHISNSLGTINPVAEIVKLAHYSGALVLVDGAQAGPHSLIDVQSIDADFYTLSCHKIYAPTGTGVLYGKLSLLESMPPYQGGGDMIRTVRFEKTTYAPVPAKFEAGTPNVAGVIGLGAAIEYLADLCGADGTLRERLVRSMSAIHAREFDLLNFTTVRLEAIEGVKIVGKAKSKAAVISFTIAGIHPHDIGTVLDDDGIAIRAGHHCCMPLMERLALVATARASFAFYNDENDAERLITGVKRVQEMFK